MQQQLEKTISQIGGVRSLARAINVSAGMVSHWRHGRYAISERHAIRLEALTGIDRQTWLDQADPSSSIIIGADASVV